MEPIGSCAIEGCMGRAEPKQSDFPICGWHFSKIIKKYRADVKALDDSLRGNATDYDEQRRLWLAKREQVYYVRTVENVIKIGFTAHLVNRMKSYRLPLTHLLATEPGGRSVEYARHQQFADYRLGKRREDFRSAPDLMAHIQLMRETHDTVLTDDPYQKQIIIPRLVAPA